jgi:RNA polymerase sigma factor (sigma-70 family)
MAAVEETGASQRDATHALWSRYHAGVYRYALSQLRSPQDAEDATQNTFLRAFNALQRGVVPENEAAWLFKIAHNTCTSSKLAWLRRRRVETPHDVALLEAPALDRRQDELAGLGDALAGMAPRPREAFLLREWQGLSYAEIAERMNTSQSAVETLIFRARRTLAEQLQSPLRRVRQALGIGPLLGMLRGWIGGGSLAVKAAGAAAVVATATVAATQTDVARTPQRPHAPAVSVTPSSPTSAKPSARVRRTLHGAKHDVQHTQPATHAAAPPPPEQTVAPAAPSASPPQSSPVPTAPQPATPAETVTVATDVTPPALPTPPDLAALPPVSAPAQPNVVPAVPQLPAVPPLPFAPPVPALPQLP